MSQNLKKSPISFEIYSVSGIFFSNCLIICVQNYFSTKLCWWETKGSIQPFLKFRYVQLKRVPSHSYKTYTLGETIFSTLLFRWLWSVMSWEEFRQFRQQNLDTLKMKYSPWIWRFFFSFQVRLQDLITTLEFCPPWIENF